MLTLVQHANTEDFNGVTMETLEERDERVPGYSSKSLKMGMMANISLLDKTILWQSFSTCGLFTAIGVTYRRSCISDIYITIHNSSKT